MTTANLAWADCISDCEANCLFLGDPGAIGLCISSCPANCAAIPPPPACTTTGGVNGCSNTAVRLTPSNTGSGGKWTLSNDGTGGSAKAFMTLSCSNVAVIKTAFKGSRTVNVGSTPQIGCGALGFTFSSTCGRNNTCSGGVN